MPRKNHREKEQKWADDEEEPEDKVAEKEDDDEDTIDLDKAEEEEDDDEDDDDEEEEFLGESVEDLERKRLFQTEGEEILEHLTMDDLREVLTENEMDTALASRLKKILSEVVLEGESISMDEVWEEALTRLEDE